jgi:hypothetical protein
MATNKVARTKTVLIYAAIADGIVRQAFIEIWIIGEMSDLFNLNATILPRTPVSIKKRTFDIHNII